MDWTHWQGLQVTYISLQVLRQHWPVVRKQLASSDEIVSSNLLVNAIIKLNRHSKRATLDYLLHARLTTAPHGCTQAGIQLGMLHVQQHVWHAAAVKPL
jgi:hypothetical protein